MSVYKVIELVGTSDKSWEDAAKQAIDMANKSLRDLRIAEISKMDVRLDEGEIVEYRVRVNVSFKYED
ncbi:MAG: dodecin domain-containing protein [Anaerolineaceae bacterium]|nr:transporter [Chloroflexota bacterium]UCC52185.1 MAG: dodecin domain-containing protein [Anaerolineaceae bacterium]